MSQAWYYRALAAVQQSLGAGGAAEAARAAQAAAEAVIEGTPDADHRDCAAGCAFCCHFPVGVSYAEAELLVEAIGGDPGLRAAVLAGAREVAEYSWQRLAASLRPCPLLRDGRCAAYGSRPLGCRGWNSTSAAACERSFAGAGDAVPVDAAAFAAALGAGTALREWCAAEQLPEQPRELRSALAAMMTASVAERPAAFAAARPAG